MENRFINGPAGRFIFLAIFVFSFALNAQEKDSQKGQNTGDGLSFQIQKIQKLYANGKNIKNNWLAFELIDANYYFAASIFAKRHLIANGEHNDIFEEALEKIVVKTGVEVFADLPEDILTKAKGPTLALVLGLRKFREKRYQESLKALEIIPAHHRFGPEALLISGTIYNLQGMQNKAIDLYRTCHRTATYAANKSKHEKLERYYSLISEFCLIHTARMEYKNKQYDKSLMLYDDIDKNSYQWPYILLEKAWGQYQSQDYNRTLGLLVTYKSPLLDSYFFPEAELLTALSYFKLCLYDDALQIIDNYYADYRPKSESLKLTLAKLAKEKNGFLATIFKQRSEKEDLGPFISKLATQIRKEVKFNLDLLTLRRAQDEIQAFNSWPNSMVKYLLIGEIQDMANYLEHGLNQYVASKFYKFINDVHKFSYELFNIKLEILSKKRGLIYSNLKLVADRARGSEINVKRKSTQHFWDFRGGFWADELGEYSFGLKSNCQEIGIKNAQGDKQ